MLRGDLGQKRNPLLIAIITAVSFFIGLSLVKYLWRGQFDLIESLISALVFFIVYYFLGSYLNKKMGRKKQKSEEKNYD